MSYTVPYDQQKLDNIFLEDESALLICSSTSPRLFLDTNSLGALLTLQLELADALICKVCSHLDCANATIRTKTDAQLCDNARQVCRYTSQQH
jgi:hypothetical protein